MLDFSRLKAPARHGEILVDPQPTPCVAAARANRARLDACRVPIGGLPLGDLRRQTRAKSCDSTEGLVIVTGHQPEFMHAGVWAKRVVSSRMANAIGGTAVDLVVDTDAPASSDLLVPSLHGDRVELRRIPIAPTRAGIPYEQFQPLPADDVWRFERELREAMGTRFERSMMPMYLEGLRRATGASTWVDQTLGGRRAVEDVLAVRVREARVSQAWWSPLLAELLLKGSRFAAAYNSALGFYRREHKMRGPARPIPNLQIADRLVEIPIWAFRPGEARRRVFLDERADRLQLIADGEAIGEFEPSVISTADDVVDHIRRTCNWQIRPRALTLTMWARLLLADLFIHGVGGAKYDRITNEIIRRYWGIQPPEMACVTATLRLHPDEVDSRKSIDRQRRVLRDLAWNPHRDGYPSPAFARLTQERQALVDRSVRLREHGAGAHQERREVFREIRGANERLLALRAGDVDQARARLREAEDGLAQAKIATSREYFFALHERAALERLLAALPGEHEFRV